MERRRAKMERESKFYRSYVQHLPEVPVDAPFERGRLHHLVVHHDQWCNFYDDGPCNCNPFMTRRAEPRRS